MWSPHLFESKISILKKLKLIVVRFTTVKFVREGELSVSSLKSGMKKKETIMESSTDIA